MNGGEKERNVNFVAGEDGDAGMNESGSDVDSGVSDEEYEPVESEDDADLKMRVKKVKKRSQNRFGRARLHLDEKLAKGGRRRRRISSAVPSNSAVASTGPQLHTAHVAAENTMAVIGSS